MAQPAEIVLVVEDDPEICDLICEVLRAHEYFVESSSSGVAALKLLRTMSNGPQVLIIDYSLPDMNGIELIRSIHTQFPDTLAICTSGFFLDNKENFDGCIVLPKPFTVDKLLEIIRSNLGHSRVTGELNA